MDSRALRRSAAGLAAVALACGLTPAPAALARPATIEDLLQREEFGAITVSPGGRWLLVEQQAPYASAARYDRLMLNPMLRTRIMVAELGRVGGLKPLFPAESGMGYSLGPTSPNGRWVAVTRMGPNVWELGLAEIPTGRVRWLGVGPELVSGARTLQWAAPDTLAVIALQDDDTPYELRWMTPQAPLPSRWETSAVGGASVSVLGSGRLSETRLSPTPRRLLLVSAEDGAVRQLAAGDFTDLEVSPQAGRIALLEAAEDIPLTAERPLQGAYGLAPRRMRLVIVDPRTGRLRRPCPGLDMLGGLMSWSPRGDALLVFARRPGEPWTEGRLLRVDARTGTARPVAPNLHPVVERRPEVVYAGWWERDPIVFARASREGRADWYRLGPEGPVRLTGELATPPREGLVVGSQSILASADGAAWRLDRFGRAKRLLKGGFKGLARSSSGVPSRDALAPQVGEHLAGVLPFASGARLVRLDGGGAMTDGGPLPPRRRTLLDAGPGAGALVVRIDGGGRELLEQLRLGEPPRPLAEINAHLADVDAPTMVAVPHPGPDGLQRSWLLLPARSRAAGRPPPLIVLPYPGEVYAEPPDQLILARPAFYPAAPLVGAGYAVLLPSLPPTDAPSGPAEGLADRLLAIIDVAGRQPGLEGAFDAARLGLWGHSFGGYAVLSALTQTDRFRAAAAQAAPSNLVSLHGAFSPGRRTHTDGGVGTPWSAGWVESLQGDMRQPPWADPERYRRNSPVMLADRITTPLMLVHGDQDNFPLSQAEEMFSQLYRQGKDALLVTYWGEGHIYASPGNLRDLHARLLAWYDAFLLEPINGAGGGPPTERPEHDPASSAPKPPPPPRKSARARRDAG